MAVKNGVEYVGGEEVKSKRAVSAVLKGRWRSGQEEQIEIRIKIAKDLNATRNQKMDDVEDILKQIYAKVKKDVADTETPLIKTPRGQAIVDAVRALLGPQAELDSQVLPLKGGIREQEICTKLERGLSGLEFEMESATGTLPYRSAVYWFLARGLGVLKTQYYPEASRCPLRMEAPDPRYVYPVEEDRLLWVAEEKYKYVGEFKRYLAGIKALRKGRRLVWRMPDLEGYKDTDKVLLTSYQDDEWEALKAGDEWVFIRPNGLGFIHYAFGKCRMTPDAEPAWASQSIIAPILGLLLIETEILTKFGPGMSLLFYPRLLIQHPEGKGTILDAAPGEVDNISPESTINVLTQQSQTKEAIDLLAQAQGLMSLIGLPGVMFGEPPGQVQAGYPMSLLISAGKTKLRTEAGQLEWMYAQSQEHLLRHIEKFGGLNEGFSVYVGLEGDKRGRKALLTLTDKDVAGHYRVKVSLKPKIPQDWVQLGVVAERFRRKGVDGRPLLSDYTLRETILELRSPEEEEERIFEQEMRQHEEVRRYQQEKWLEEWQAEGDKTA